MYLTPKRFAPSCLTDAECLKRVGSAYATPFPWDQVCGEELKDWLYLVAGARKCRPEYLLLSMLPTIAAVCGPETKLEIAPGYHEERLNMFMCVLGETGASKLNQ